MANYIDDEILCEGYTHFKVDEYPDAEALAQLKNEITSFMQDRAKFLLGEDVKIIVEFEEGSLKTTVKVVGSAALVIALAIGDYGSFRAGVKQATDDVTMLAQSANLELIFRTKTASCDRLRLESRKGVLGRVDNLLNTLEQTRILTNQADLPAKRSEQTKFKLAVGKLVEWEKRSDRLLSKITDPSTKACIAAGFAEELEKFDEEPHWVATLKSDKFQRVMIATDTANLARVSELATFYTVTVQTLKTNLQIHMKKSAPRLT